MEGPNTPSLSNACLRHLGLLLVGFLFGWGFFKSSIGIF